jgi:D-alanyl-D-alanine carboxypeptidase/D-alanyl-D-alanine-endopeptidase (penicillin-binding protein 4)
MKKIFHDGCRFFFTLFVSLLGGIIISPVYADNVPAGIDEIVAHYKNATVGVQIQSMNSGRILYQYNANNYFTPASTFKTFTAVAALSYLGPDYVFKTQLLSTASTVNQGVLHSDIYLKFAGDPTLTYNDLSQLLATLTKSGVHTIQGNVYVDASLFDDEWIAPGLSDEEQHFCYAASMSAVILNKNCYSFELVPGRPGQHALLKNSLTSQFVNFNNSVVTSTRRMRGGCALNVKTDANNNYVLSGCLRRNIRGVGFGVPIRNPKIYGLYVTRALLRHLGIQVTGKIELEKTPPHLIVLAEHNSAPLAALVKHMLKKSDNIIAEALYKKLGAALYGEGTWITGKQAVMQILEKNAHIDFREVRLIDGSGLSPYNQVSPLAMSQLLHYAFHDNNIRQPFLNALPLSGVDGTLRNRMGNNGMLRRVRAKTGTINHVTGLAGYVQTNHNEILSFVVFVNNFNGPTSYFRTVEDRISTFLAHT